jgi:hypothetical protein
MCIGMSADCGVLRVMRDEYGVQVTRNGLMVVVMAHAVTKDDEGVDSLNERVVDVDVDVDVMNTPMR